MPVKPPVVHRSWYRGQPFPILGCGVAMRGHSTTDPSMVTCSKCLRIMKKAPK